MKIKPSTLLQDSYDIIVVGAGLGGLTAASLLAKRGLSVLLVDQQNKPGGSCTSFKREDHVFDVGTAMIYGFGEKGFRPFHFLFNELEEPIDVVAHPTLARMTFEGREIIFYPDVDQFVEELIRIFPQEEQGLRAFFADLYKMYTNIVVKNEIISPPSELSPRQALRQLMSDPPAIIKMQRLLSTSTMEILKKYLRSPEVLNFFDKLCSAYDYTTAEETPGVLAATMFIDNHVGGVYFPAGGAQMLPNTIEKAFERAGGQAFYRQLVKEIIIRNGTACGVRLSDGTEIHAERVIANATVWNIYGKLVKPEHIRPERMKWAQGLIPTFPSMTLYMVVDREAIPEGVYPWEIFIENRKVIDSTDLTLYINSLVDKTLYPADELVVMAISPNLCEWPHPDDPRYRSNEYEAQKQREAEKMLDQIESHIPRFRAHIRNLIIGSPTTIERYLLKNGGAVGGPKNQIGQEMLKRLHAKSEWKHLYFCGDSTTMGTGAPATTVSGIGAANVILRELRLPQYDSRKFPRRYIHMVDLPFSRPDYKPGDALSDENAWLAAAACQGCQEPACQAGCPAGIDIPGFLRRMEVKNYPGAARLIREMNPFGETCGLLCAAERLCQRNCIRRDFTGKAVRIAELQQWVCEKASAAGWIQQEVNTRDARVAVFSGGPAGLSCAWYLRLAGYCVTLFGAEELPGGILLRYDIDARLRNAIHRDVEGIMAGGIIFQGTQTADKVNIQKVLYEYAAVYLACPSSTTEAHPCLHWFGENWKDSLNQQTGQLGDFPKVFIGEEFKMNGLSVVDAAAGGRKSAMAIQQFLQY